MGIIVKPLSNTEIKNAKPKDKEYKLNDGDGLILVVRPNGNKIFRYRCRLNGGDKTYTIGQYPTVSLLEARKAKQDIKEKLFQGIGLVEQKLEKEVKTLNNVFDEWLKVVKVSWKNITYEKVLSVYDKNFRNYCGKTLIKELKRKDLIEDIERIQKRGANQTAERIITQLNRVYKYAVTKEYVEHNIIADIDKKSIIQSHKKQHFNAITDPIELKKLINNINDYRHIFAHDLGTAIALEIAPYLILRPANLRGLKKDWINFEKKYIYIPAEFMKMQEDFIMPINDYIIEKLKEAIKIEYKNSEFVFPSTRNKNEPLSNNTLRACLQRMGYNEIHTIHGFRSSFSTNMHILRYEHGFDSDIIESCLAHQDTNKIRAAYNRTEVYKYLDEKRKLMDFYFTWIEKITL
ncbi:tyrosine-type recombinase/integrase [Aliarcobacter butzleri]|uniref:tyrosine-type recombinase/integrase n=1 Tax=Aliarcobacter butzleri TaxID=28197 RepID=UPI003AFA6329